MNLAGSAASTGIPSPCRNIALFKKALFINSLMNMSDDLQNLPTGVVTKHPDVHKSRRKTEFCR
ncbi:hypothetical protein [Thauera chlorobenzoica]|uniref:hypothetical protein n=1 Tax=Thauera chlorobenzoica TaxID=96773 RepID=UPI0011B0AC29|nr:hypothetical protein [Thauera chlorobenzoica]